MANFTGRMDFCGIERGFRHGKLEVLDVCKDLEFVFST